MAKIRQYLILFFCLIIHAGTKAQMMDSIANSFSFKPRPVFKFNARNSFIASRTARINGFQLGANFNNTVEVGAGYNWLQSNKYDARPVPQGVEIFELKFQFISAYFDYTFHKSKRWQLSIPLQLGVGKSYFGAIQINPGERHSEDWIVLYEPGMTAEFRPIRFVGIGMGMGYRLMLKNNKAIDQGFTSPIYLLKGLIYLGEIFRTATAPKT